MSGALSRAGGAALGLVRRRRAPPVLALALGAAVPRILAARAHFAGRAGLRAKAAHPHRREFLPRNYLHLGAYTCPLFGST